MFDDLAPLFNELTIGFYYQQLVSRALTAISMTICVTGRREDLGFLSAITQGKKVFRVCLYDATPVHQLDFSLVCNEIIT